MSEADDLLELPAWSLAAERLEDAEVASAWSHPPTREWAWGGSTGAGARVAIVDSGIAAGHELVGAIQRSVAVRVEGGTPVVEDVEAEDVSGHGTACAGIVRAIAPDCELTSVRVLGTQATGKGGVLVEGLRWAIRERFDVVNLSLSTRKPEVAAALHTLADEAYFAGTMLVASAHNLLVHSFPWRFAAVISVASHELDDPWTVLANPEPPVDFFARGVDVEVAWPPDGRTRVTGNSFATPHVAGLCALVLAKHPGLTPFELKTLLRLAAANVRPA